VKTISLKKVSAVAVASLGFGLLSVVPVQAATFDTGGELSCVQSLENNASGGTTCTGAVGGQVKLTFLEDATTDYKITVSGMTIVRVDGSVYAVDAVASSGSADEHSYVNGSNTNDGIWYNGDDTDNGGTFDLVLTSAVAGTGTITLTSYNASTGVGTVVSTGSITWGASALTGLSQANSDFEILDSAADCDSTASRANDQTVLTANKRSSIAYDDTNGTRALHGCLILRTGLGTVFDGDGLDTFLVTTTIGSLASGSLSRSSSTKTTSGDSNDDALSTQIFGDGLAAGTGSITVTAIEGTTAVTFTKTFTQFGEIAKLAMTPVTYAGKTAGSTVWDAPDYVTDGEVAVAFTLAATDANSAAVTNFDYDNTSAEYTLYKVVDSDLVAGSPTFNVNNPADATEAGIPTVVVDGYGTASAVGASTAYVTVDCSAATMSSQKLNITVYAPDVDGKYTVSATGVYYCSGAVSTITVTPTATSVAAGGTTTFNIAAKDAKGYPVADGTSVSLVASNGASVAPGSTTTANGAIATAPTVVTSNSASSTVVTAIIGSVSGNATVNTTGAASNQSAQAMLDSLNAKLVALNALIAKIMKKLGVK
jgi:hypothetical protein